MASLGGRSRQARWALESKEEAPEHILPTSQVVAAVSLENQGGSQSGPAVSTWPRYWPYRQTVRPGFSHGEGLTMGTLLQAGLPSRCHPHAGPTKPKVLVASHGSRYPGVCLRLHCLRTEQDVEPAQLWSAFSPYPSPDIPGPTSPWMCLWLLATTLLLPGIWGLCPVSTTSSPALLQDLASGKVSPPSGLPAIPATLQSLPDYCPSLRLVKRYGCPLVTYPFEQTPASPPANALAHSPSPKSWAPSAVHLQLPRTMHIHPTFHTSCIKPVIHSPLVPPVPPPSTPHPLAWSTMNQLTRFAAFLTVGVEAGAYSTWWTGRGTAQRNWIPRRQILDPSMIRDFPSQPS